MTLTQRILERDDWRCAYCGGRAVHAEHVVAKAMRRRHHIAADDERYIVASCAADNYRKLTHKLYPKGFDTSLLPGTGWQEWDGGKLPEVRR